MPRQPQPKLLRAVNVAPESYATVSCPSCQGEGWFQTEGGQGYEPCVHCAGSGRPRWGPEAPLHFEYADAQLQLYAKGCVSNSELQKSFTEMGTPVPISVKPNPVPEAESIATSPRYRQHKVSRHSENKEQTYHYANLNTQKRIAEIVMRPRRPRQATT